jgi:hypothetical protein
VTNKPAPEDMRELWQSQPTEPLGIHPQDMRRKMDKFEGRIFRRNLREYAGAMMVIAVFAYFEWKSQALLVRVASGLLIAGALYVIYQIHRRASSRTVPADLGLNACIEFHRQSLERQRDALQAVWSWYLLPLVPGLAVFQAGSIMNQWTAHPAGPVRSVVVSLVSPAIMTAAFFVIWKLNRRAAQRLQTQIDELNALGKDSPSARA